MNIERIGSLLKGMGDLRESSKEEISEFSSVTSNPELNDYLEKCLTEEGVFTSGVRVKNLAQLRDENLSETSPGAYIFPFGFLVVGTSIGGNAICVDSRTSSVYWANSVDFLDDALSFEDKTSGEWLELEYNYENILRALVHLGDDWEAFVIGLLEGKLESRLEALE